MSEPRKRDTSRKLMPPHVRLRLIGMCILIAGLLGSALIYFIAADGRDGAIGYEIEGGNVYPVMQGEYKRSQLELEKVGGKFSVVAAQLDDWFSGLWHGKQLGLTLAFISVCAAAGCFFFAHLLSFQPPADDSHKSD